MADESLFLTDGQLSFLGGVSSDVPRTKIINLSGQATTAGESPAIVDGVGVNQLSWAINCSVRGGGISPRPSVHPLVQGAPWSGLFQGAIMYQPDASDPIIIMAVGGRFYRVRVDTDNSVTDLSNYFGLGLPASIPHYFFTQAEMFAVIQAGDLTTRPLFYDFGLEGFRPEAMRQSNGFVGIGNPANEIPPAGPMAYHAQRLWYAFQRSYAAGDIVRNRTSGGAAWAYRDSVLKVTENPVAYAGDAFVVPTNAGNIRGMGYASNLNTTLGESDLFIFTRRNVYASSPPITREDWAAATLDLMPIQKVALAKGGAYGDRCIVPVNSDIFFAGPPDGDIRSVRTAVRDSLTWGNVPLSTNVARALITNNRSLLSESSGIQFDNRLLMTTLPKTTPVGVGFQGIIPLDFDTISTFTGEDSISKTPAWDGIYDFSGGPIILQLLEGDFGGRERAFAIVWSERNSQIEVWEIRPDLRFDGNENRITRIIEFPAYAFGNPFQLKELVGGELWIDKLLGTVDFELYYRPDSYACWIFWHVFRKCAAKDCREDVDNPCPDTGYPQEPYCEQDAIPIAFPKPPVFCMHNTKRPTTQGFQFQVKLVIKGWARVRGLLLHALPRLKEPYMGLDCAVDVRKLGGIPSASL